MYKVNYVIILIILYLISLSCVKRNSTEPTPAIPNQQRLNVVVNEVIAANRFIVKIDNKNYTIYVADLYCYEIEKNITLREQAKLAGISEDSALAIGNRALEFSKEFLLNNEVTILRDMTRANSLSTGELFRVVYRGQNRYDSLMSAMNLSAPRKPQIDDNEFYAIVNWIFDGDTFDFRYDGVNHRVRVLGIDCYEAQKNERLAEQARKNNISIDSALALGLAAKEFAIATLRNKEVLLMRGGTAPNKDVYDRYLRLVFIDGMPYDSLIIVSGFGAN